MDRLVARPLALTTLALAALLGSARAQTITYDASSGALPDPPCWKLYDSANPEQPVVQNGQLVISTSADGENMTYGWESQLNIPAHFVIEVRMQLVSGTSSTFARAPASVGFSTEAFTGNILQIDHDKIFVMASNSVVGATAVVDTDDQPHTYRIEVTGTTAGSLLEVYYDGEATPRLVDDIVMDPNINWPAPRVFFGEGSVFTKGTSVWEMVSHNAGPADCCGQSNSCGNITNLASLGVVSGGTYDANSGATWDLVLPGVPAEPSAGMLIYGFAPSNPSGPIQTTFGNLCVGPFVRGAVALPDAITGGCANPTQYTWGNWSTWVDTHKAAGTKGFTGVGTDEVWIQAWHRDPTLTSGGVLSKLAGPFFVAP